MEGNMSKAQMGNSVKVHYTGTFDDGTVFDSSREREPLEFEIGKEQVIPGFETGVIGMEKGESKKIHIAHKEAYGPHRTELVAEVSKSDFPADITPEIGQQLQMGQPDQQPVIVTITAIDDDKITLDANHPLAGKDINFELELVEIVS